MAKDKYTIITDSGAEVEGVAPVIISASRSTDIPAFHAKWFLNRFKKGYCVWYNPFNQKPTYVSFSRCKVVVFWSKNPRPIMPYLSELDRMGVHYYFQVTLNDYESEGFEPGVPPLEERLESFCRLSSRIGPDRVVWRYDPIISTPKLTPQEHLRRIERIGNRLKGLARKLVFSFVDVDDYRCVQANLIGETPYFSRADVLSAEPTKAQRCEIVKGLLDLRERWRSEGWMLSLATCCEADDFVGVEHNRCIDGELMERVFGEDRALVYYLHTGKLPEVDLFGGALDVPDARKDMKDKGQRPFCGCIRSKDIGMYNTCRHFCAYCYANRNRSCVTWNLARRSEDSESIVGMEGNNK